MEQDILSLLKENNEMLREILGYLRMLNSDDYRSNEDMRSFSINVCADIFVEMLEKNSELKNKVTDIFKK